MSVPANLLATYADLLALPEDIRAEVLAGEVVTAPSPLPGHSRAQRTLSGVIGLPFDTEHGRGGPGGWWIFLEIDVALGSHDVVRPDLAGWRRERLPHPRNTRPIVLAPDWICEVLSPSTVGRDRGYKRDLYARAAVGHYWVVDTDARILEAFELDGGRWMLNGTYGDQDIARIAPFAEIELRVGDMFMPLEDSPALSEVVEDLGGPATS